MSKASRRKQNNQKRKIANFSYQDPAVFDYHWERRLDTWLKDIRLTPAHWSTQAIAKNERVFKILDNAMKILEGCDPDIYKRYAERTYEILCDACCQHVAGIMDSRLYHLSQKSKY